MTMEIIFKRIRNSHKTFLSITQALKIPKHTGSTVRMTIGKYVLKLGLICRVITS